MKEGGPNGKPFFLCRSAFTDYDDEDGSSDNESVDAIPSTLKRELRTLDSRFHVSITSNIRVAISAFVIMIDTRIDMSSGP